MRGAPARDHRQWLMTLALTLCSLSGICAASLPTLGSLSGKVTAVKAFQGAQVYIRNMDKHVLYMVYTAGGHYRAVDLLPGKYEVSVKKKGFATEVKELEVKPGSAIVANFSLQEGDFKPAQLAVFNGANAARGQPMPVRYDELYPPGTGKAVVERTCVACHGVNFLPGHRGGWTEGTASGAISLMTNAGIDTARGTGMITPQMMSLADRKAAVAYIASNFGPDAPRRSVQVDDYPIDEKALGSAMYVEYYLPLDAPSADQEKAAAGPLGRGRRAQEPHFDANGNVWYTDRGIPNRVGVLNPRTAEFKDYVLPIPTADPHGLTVDPQGHVWWSETRGLHLGRLDPKTNEMQRYDMNIAGKITGGQGHTPVLDSKQNIWFSVIIGNKIGKWDRAQQKVVALYEIPTRNSYPYGILVDKNDKIWFAEYAGCNIGRFDPATEKFTEFPPLTKPCQIRRLGMDQKGIVWFGIYSHGKLGRLDPSTGKVTEYKIPLAYSEPYDAWPDAEGNIWVPDDGQGGTLMKFVPRTEQFTYYPAPQNGDMPKLAITREGAIWYTPRSSANAAVGVLYPDVNKITTLAAYY
jgi:virginiamycin B lyase